MALKTLIVGLLSAGWLFPAFVTYSWFISSQDRGNSFPFARYSVYAFAITCGWLGVVIVAWSGIAIKRLQSPQAK